MASHYTRNETAAEHLERQAVHRRERIESEAAARTALAGRIQAHTELMTDARRHPTLARVDHEYLTEMVYEYEGRAALTPEQAIDAEDLERAAEFAARQWYAR